MGLGYRLNVQHGHPSAGYLFPMLKYQYVHPSAGYLFPMLKYQHVHPSAGLLFPMGKAQQASAVSVCVCVLLFSGVKQSVCISVAGLGGDAELI